MGKILIVDDSQFMRMTLSNIIRKLNHEVAAEAKTGKEAVQLYRFHRPDLVFMDITMPDMNGIEAIKMIKNEYPDAQIIICSAMAQQKIVMDAIEAGAKDFIVKPFEEMRIVDTIERHTM
ncbi:response regulator [Fervidibacillus halotolerans]|uniref:Response regulator n=1 Tax=Fervidibacillus halotolerans TaxID=2980027 RepID=A0A9E8M169_9BACI|nr:response regulator [Fervidibacillus halotolerans]WAA13497.1 response regulator [Fervidibacillus halotolerans]